MTRGSNQSHAADMLARGLAASAFRTSRANVERRLKRGEAVTVCGRCGTEMDTGVDPIHGESCWRGLPRAAQFE